MQLEISKNTNYLAEYLIIPLKLAPFIRWIPKLFVVPITLDFASAPLCKPNNKGLAKIIEFQMCISFSI